MRLRDHIHHTAHRTGVAPCGRADHTAPLGCKLYIYAASASRPFKRAYRIQVTARTRGARRAARHSWLVDAESYGMENKGVMGLTEVRNRWFLVPRFNRASFICGGTTGKRYRLPVHGSGRHTLLRWPPVGPVSAATPRPACHACTHARTVSRVSQATCVICERL